MAGPLEILFASYTGLVKVREREKEERRREIAFLIALSAGLSSAKLLKGR